MLQFLFGVAFGAAGYWAWQSFGRDLLGMGGDQGEATYGGFSNTSSGTSFGSTPSSSLSPDSTSSSPSNATGSGSVSSGSGTTTSSSS